MTKLPFAVKSQDLPSLFASKCHALFSLDVWSAEFFHSRVDKMAVAL